MPKKIPGSKLDIEKFKRFVTVSRDIFISAFKYENMARDEFMAAIPKAKKRSDLKALAEAYLDAMSAREKAQAKVDAAALQASRDLCCAELPPLKAGSYYKWRWVHEKAWNIVMVSEDADKNKYLNYIGVATPLSMHDMNLKEYEYIEIHLPQEM